MNTTDRIAHNESRDLLELRQKWCPQCQKVKYLHEFHKNKANQPSGRYGFCKECQNAKMRERRSNAGD